MSFIVFILLFTVLCGWLDSKARFMKEEEVK